MPQPHYPTAEEVKALLDSAEVKSYEQAVAEQSGLPLLTDYAIHYSDIQRQLYLARLTAEDALSILQREKTRLLEWNVLMNHREEEHPDGEFPEGEEQDPDDVSVTIGEPLGVIHGFSAGQICLYHLASQDKAAALLIYLERTQMPYRKKVCAELRKLYREIQSD